MGKRFRYADMTVWSNGCYDNILPLDGKKEPKTTTIFTGFTETEGGMGWFLVQAFLMSFLWLWIINNPCSPDISSSSCRRIMLQNKSGKYSLPVFYSAWGFHLPKKKKKKEKRNYEAKANNSVRKKNILKLTDRNQLSSSVLSESGPLLHRRCYELCCLLL